MGKKLNTTSLFPGRSLVLRSAADRQVFLHQTGGRPDALDGGRGGGKERRESLAGNF